MKYDDYGSSGDFLVLPAQTTTYRLASIRNACGTGLRQSGLVVGLVAWGYVLPEFRLGFRSPYCRSRSRLAHSQRWF